MEEGLLVAEIDSPAGARAPNGFLHAATVIALADTACGYGCIAHLPEGAENFTTVELKCNFLGTARDGTIVGTAKLTHSGRTTQVWDATGRAAGRRATDRPLSLHADDPLAEIGRMKVLVLGSGVIGVSTAHYLAQAGHEVTVVDRQPEPALETSFANAGEVSPGYSAPWAAPGLPQKAIKWLFMRHRPLVIWPILDPAMWLWGLRLLANCTEARYDVNKNRMLRLAEYSRACLEALRADTGIRYDERMQGTLQLFRTQSQVDGAAADIAILEHFGVRYELLDRAGCVRSEPAARARATEDRRRSAPSGDETGDCFKFTQGLARIAAQAGVTFRQGVHISRCARKAIASPGSTPDAGPAHRRRLRRGARQPLAADAALAADRGSRLSGQGLFPDDPIEDAAKAPESTVMDETYKVAVTRLGDRIRVGGTAGAHGLQPEAARCAP
jgi:D-amino-acid dehydrogenase